MKYLKYLLFGIIFGIILVKAEVISWFRIQEMFRFQSIHMYGIIGVAIVVGLISVQLIKKFQIGVIGGGKADLVGKTFNWRSNLFGGILFGFGWAMTGACPGPMYSLIGAGYWIVIIPTLAAFFGAYVYGAIRKKLPH